MSAPRRWAAVASLALLAACATEEDQGSSIVVTFSPGGQVRAGDAVAALALDRPAGTGEVVEVALDVLPGSLLQGLGMALAVAPLTATVLAAAPDTLAGVASGVNNAVARAAQLLAVAALPLAVGLAGNDYADPMTFATGYRTAMLLCAALFALGGLLAWATVRDDGLRA